MDWVQLDAMFEFVGSVCGVCGLLATLYLNSKFVTRQAFNTAMESVRDRLATSDRKHDAAATGDELGKLNLTIAHLTGTIAALEERVRGMSSAFDRQSDTVDRIEEFLLNRSRS